MKMYQVLSPFGLDNVDIYLRDGSISIYMGIFNLHRSRGTHWVWYRNENHFYSYACSSSKKLSKFNIKRNGQCLYFEYKIQGL